MKTAEECVIGLMQLAGSDPKSLEKLKTTKEFRQAEDYFQQVQIDGIKEGMYRAASMCRNHSLDYDQEQSILTAANQLTEKNL